MDTNDKQKRNDYRDEFFEYQQAILKEELGTIERVIARLDGTINNNKNWAILTWAGSISILLQDRVLDNYVIFTATIPLLFWLAAARAYYHQTTAIYRQRKISEYVNSDKLSESFREKRFVDFKLLDITGEQYKRTEDFKDTISYWKVLKYKSLSILFGGMIFLSLGIWLILYLYGP